jgi:AcrR family transcriptional regulator
MEKRRGRPKALPDEYQRACIVEHARQLFLKHGYGGTTTEDIAGACHISKQTLYRLFPGKCGLFGAVIDSHRQDMLDIKDSYHELPLELALEKILRIDISPEDDHERLALIRLVVTEAPQFPELTDITQTCGREKSQAALTAWLEQRRARGEIVIDDTGSAASMLLDMIFGSPLSKALRDFEWPGSAERQAYIRRCISVFLHGVCPQ